MVKDDLPCTGVQVGSSSLCWAHLPPQQLSQALRSLGPGEALDLRGTTLDKALTRRILDKFRDPRTHELLIGDASLENTKISGEVSFSGAVFEGDARFFGCDFHDKADFYGTEFKQYAGFNDARFDYLDFGKARFSRGPISFKYVTFRDTAEFDDTVFAGRTEFSYADFRRHAGFSQVRFEGEAEFNGVTFHSASFQHGRFEDEASFYSAKFMMHADFIDVYFGKACSFGGAKFKDNAWLTNCKFSGKADFSEARFNAGAWFARSQFGSDVSFETAEVAADALFNDVTFAGDARFDEVKIKGTTVLGPSTVKGELRLNGFEASGTVEATAAANRVTCTRSKFTDRVWLSLVGGDLWLVDSVFTSPVTVESSLRPVGGIGPTPGGEPVRVRLRSLRGTDAEHLTLIDADLSRCVLSGLRRPEQLRLEGRCVFAPTPRGWHRRWEIRLWRWRWRPRLWRWTARETLFEEHLWRASDTAPGPHDGWARLPDDDAEDIGTSNPERLEVLYRQLRAVFEGASNEPGAADFYYGEMEMRRHAGHRGSERWLLGWYWFLSGYGLRGSRALGGLVVLILSAALVLQYIGFPGQVPSYLYCALYAAGSVVSVTLASNHLPEVLTGWGDIIRIVLRIAGPVMLGLAALAVRGRVKR